MSQPLVIANSVSLLNPSDVIKLLDLLIYIIQSRGSNGGNKTLTGILSGQAVFFKTLEQDCNEVAFFLFPYTTFLCELGWVNCKDSWNQNYCNLKCFFVIAIGGKPLQDSFRNSLLL